MCVFSFEIIEAHAVLRKYKCCARTAEGKMPLIAQKRCSPKSERKVQEPFPTRGTEFEASTWLEELLDTRASFRQGVLSSDLIKEHEKRIS